MPELIDKPRNAKGNARGMNPQSRANLRPAHNPAGRPKKEVCVTSWLKEYASQLIAKPIDASKLTYAQAAALSAWKAAAKGELDKYNFIIERIEGKVVLQQAIDLTTKGKEINGQRDIPANVIDEAMEILYKSGCDSPPPDTHGASQA